MSVTKIIYKDIAPGAADDATASSSAALEGSDLSLIPFGIEPPMSIATTELGNWGLDGAFDFFDGEGIAFWSDSMSGDDCVYAAPPVLSIAFTGQFSSVGITIFFDSSSYMYCTDLNIKWYLGTTLLADVDYTPSTTSYFCQRNVERYDRVEITLQKSNLPRRYAKIEHVLFGIHRSFGMDEIRTASITAEMGGCALELPVSTFRWTLDSRENVEYMFQEKQPIEVWNDNNLIGVYYIDVHRRRTRRIYDVECHDAIGILGESLLPGAYYSNRSAKAIVLEIIDGVFEVDFGDIPDAMLSGILEPDISRREALQQVLFAWGVHMSTQGTEAIRILQPGINEVFLSDDRVYTGNDIETDSIVTKVSVTARSYTPDTSGKIIINGVAYSETETIFTVTNPDIAETTKENEKEVTSATLVSPAIGQATAQRVFDYLSRRDTLSTKFVWRGEKLGDRISTSVDWGTVTGDLEKMEIHLSNTVAVSTTAKGV